MSQSAVIYQPWLKSTQLSPLKLQSIRYLQHSPGAVEGAE